MHNRPIQTSIQRKLSPKTPFIQAKSNGRFFSASNISSIQQKENENQDADIKEGLANEGVQLKSAVGDSNPYNSDAPLVGLNDQKTVQQKPASGGGTKLPPAIQAKMENSFGADFSDVNIHKDSKSAQNMGALAYAQGTDLHFAPGQFKMDKSGQKLLGHELTHVVQQKQGRVKATKQMKAGGMAYNDDPALEREADVMGEKAANGEKVSQLSLGKHLNSGAAVVMQYMRDTEIIQKQNSQEGGKFCINSNKVNEGLTAGHAWLSYEPINGSKTTYGTWGNREPVGLHRNLELSLTPKAKRCKDITADEHATLESFASSNNTWGYINNCASFAARGWEAVTGESIPHKSLGIPNPSALGAGIESMGGENAESNTPQQENNSSSSL